MEYKKIKIREDFIRLDSAMKLADMVVTGGHAKIVIQDGEVKLNGAICTMRGKKLHSGDRVEFDGRGFEVE
mgnify:FL=1